MIIKGKKQTKVKEGWLRFKHSSELKWEEVMESHDCVLKHINDEGKGSAKNISCVSAHFTYCWFYKSANEELPSSIILY